MKIQEVKETIEKHKKRPSLMPGDAEQSLHQM
jgi:hypothetical protein